ncbi:amidase signature domain-containing protein [Rhypophila decipiens]|uniref:Amidase signature domain-containing protein n=1 Tax=Rhypophila decipiens TaxID=261697 RepID=A0AAN6XZU1_9PEZI|nr:amidase signature domain-containing protein [Rhypophila decipiens]
MDFHNPVEPLEGPEVRYEINRKSNPGIRGIWLRSAAICMEQYGWLRRLIWKNAGFDSLRVIRGHIEDYEPLFEPQIVPKRSGTSEPETLEETAAEEPEEQQEEAAKQDPNEEEDVYREKYSTVDDYRNAYLSGELTPLDVAQTLLPLVRRDGPNHPNPHSLAFFDSNIEKVMAAARASTERYKNKCSLGPLDGVPTAVKDEYDMDGYRTCLGSRNDYTGTILEDEVNTSWCVRKLEAAGAVIIGKTSMHEFGLDTTGNNPIHGTPRNPYNYRYYTGGSSSGTGYAVSAGLIPVGLGSDGGGSIRIPAALCGVFGLKPTHGRLSFRPGQNHCLTCACLGPIAADIKSLATVFEIISQPHPSSPFPPLKPLSLTPAKSSSKKILGIPRDWLSRSTPGIQSLFLEFLSTLEQEPYNYNIIDISIPFLPEGQIAHAMTVLTDAATLLPPKTTKRLTAANRILLAIGRVTPATDYILAQKLRRSLMQHLAWLWEEHPGMIILTPTTACEGLPIRKEKGEMKYGVNDGDRTLQSMEYVWLANFCGLPSLSVPMGHVPPEKGLVKKEKKKASKKDGEAGWDSEWDGEVPVGLMATGEWCSEEQLLQFGLVAEKIAAEAGLHRRPPADRWVDVIGRARTTGNS